MNNSQYNQNPFGELGMKSEITANQEQELLEILELTKEGEQKLREISEIATDLAEKYQNYYEATISNDSRLGKNR